MWPDLILSVLQHSGGKIVTLSTWNLCYFLPTNANGVAVLVHEIHRSQELLDF